MVHLLDDDLKHDDEVEAVIGSIHDEQHPPTQSSPSIPPWLDSILRPPDDTADPLAAFMSTLSTHDPPHKSILALRAAPAQRALDHLQHILDIAPADHPNRRDAIYLLIRLASASNLLPQSLFIRGVRLDSATRDPVRTGGFADIYLGHHGLCKVALKRLRVFEMAKAELHPKFCREALVWKQLKHPHVMPFFGVDAETFYSTNFLCMVSPWMEKGTILDFIKCCLEYLPRRDCHRLLREVLEGLCYLHAQKVVHGDINTANIFIDDDGHARLADFGLTIVGDLTANRMPTTAGQAGTVRWLPPEQLDTFDAGVGRRSTAGDVYAFGCLILAVYTARQPFAHLSSDFAVFMEVSAGKRPARPRPDECVGGLEMPDELWALVQRCWAQDPGARPAAGEVLEWFVEDAAVDTDTDTVVDEGSPRFGAVDEGELEEGELEEGVDALRELEKPSVIIEPDLQDGVRSESDTTVEKLTRLQTQLDSTKDARGGEEARAASILALIHFSSESGQFPNQLFLHGVELDDRRNPVLMGSYSDVFRAKYDGQPVSLRRLRAVDHDKDKLHKRFCQEALLWRQIHHPHILPVLGVDTDTFESTNFVCAVSPWMSRGNIMQYSLRDLAWDEERDFTRLLHETMLGLHWLHTHGIVHGDLHVNNVLVDDSHSARISGFSLSLVEDHTTSAGRLSATAGIAGGYMRSWAPERLARPPLGNGGAPTKSSDVYAFGMLIYQFWGRKQAFNDLPGMLSIKAIVSGKRPSRPKRDDKELPDDLWALVEACWRALPGERPSVDNIEAFFAHGIDELRKLARISKPDVKSPVGDDKLSVEAEGDAELLQRASTWPSKEGRGTFPHLFRATAMGDYIDLEGNIALRRGEVFAVLDIESDEHGRWQVRLQDGWVGLVPTHICSFVPADFIAQKRVKAITSMSSPEGFSHQLSFKRGEEFDAGLTVGVWTLCRTVASEATEAKIGLIPSCLVR